MLVRVDVCCYGLDGHNNIDSANRLSLGAWLSVYLTNGRRGSTLKKKKTKNRAPVYCVNMKEFFILFLHMFYLIFCIVH